MNTSATTLQYSDSPMLEWVLERFDIHLNNLDDTLEVVCLEKNVDLHFCSEILLMFDNAEYRPVESLMQSSVSVIIDYLEKTHRYYKGNKLLEIEQSIEKVSMESSKSNIMDRLLTNFFTAYKKELIQHIDIEEQKLFPYVRAIEAGVSLPCNYSIQQFEDSHDDTIEYELRDIQHRILMLDPDLEHSLPYHILQTQLNAFERDIHIHGWVEDHILIPKGLELEKRLANN